MQSFRVAAKKKVPPHDPVDMAAVAQQMKLSRPVSLTNLVNQLNSSIPDNIIFYSGELGPSTTTGRAGGFHDRWGRSFLGIRP